jgi:hypothetical protein
VEAREERVEQRPHPFEAGKVHEEWLTGGHSREDRLQCLGGVRGCRGPGARQPPPASCCSRNSNGGGITWAVAPSKMLRSSSRGVSFSAAC